jgi:hypothetical protein
VRRLEAKGELGADVPLPRGSCWAKRLSWIVVDLRGDIRPLANPTSGMASVPYLSV